MPHRCRYNGINATSLLPARARPGPRPAGASPGCGVIRSRRASRVTRQPPGAAGLPRSRTLPVLLPALRRGGCLVCVALAADDATLSLLIFATVINGKTVIGSIVGTRNDLADVFARHAADRTKVIAVDRKIDEVNQSIDDVCRHRPGP